MTPTQRAALEQALEALMATHYKMIDAGLLDQDLLNKNFTAHEALKDALAEQPAEQEPVAWIDITDEGQIVSSPRMYSDGSREERPLYTAPQPAIPPGYKLVPVEPTSDMQDAGWRCQPESDELLEKLSLIDTYRAMLNAAPEAPQPEAAPAVVQVPRWTLKKQHDIGIIFNECGERITACYLKEARAIVDAHNATAAPAKPAEPVAWLDEEKKIIYWHDTHETDDYHGFKRTTPLYTAPQPAIPPGYKLVPVEPTPEMERAAFNELELRGTATENGTSMRNRVYRAMLNAAPEAPQPRRRLSDEEVEAVIASWWRDDLKMKYAELCRAIEAAVWGEKT